MVPFVQHQFALTNAKAVWYGGLVFACQGVIAVFQQGAVKLLLKRLALYYLFSLYSAFKSGKFTCKRLRVRIVSPIMCAEFVPNL